MAPLHNLLNLIPLRHRLLLSISLPTTLFASATMSTINTNPHSPPPITYSPTPLPPPSPSSPPPQEPLRRIDESPDTDFYSTPRFVNHIDDAAIARLRAYYGAELLASGGGGGGGKGTKRVLDLCASWVSHFPEEMEGRARRGAEAARVRDEDEGGGKEDAALEKKGDMEEEEGGRLEVVGLGMNKEELDANPVFGKRMVWDLNTEPEVTGDVVGFPAAVEKEEDEKLDATTCVVSIDYLTRPISVLRSILAVTKRGGRIHLVISNRCFPTKVAGEWLRVGEEERVRIVGGYLWWAGWRGVEVVDLCERGLEEEGGGVVARLRGMVGGRGDPLWVVRGVKGGEGEGGGGGHEDL